jgi:Transposase DDE domain
LLSMPRLAAAVRTLFTTTADELARTHGVIRRQRKLTGAAVAQALVFGWLAAPAATLADLTRAAATAGVTISRQGLDQRFTLRTAAFLRALLEQASQAVVAADPVAIPLLRRFPQVLVLDSTTITLPPSLADTWPGCGAGNTTAGDAALKVQVRFDLVRGGLDVLDLTAGRASDCASAGQQPALVPGGLRLADLGYFSLAQLAALVAAGGHFLTRLNAQTAVFDASGRRWELATLLATHCRPDLDRAVTLGVRERLPCRLLARRVPPEVAALRRARLLATAREEGRSPSAALLAVVDWAVFVTSLPASQLTLAEALVLARARWQIELLFKLWKSAGLLDRWRTAQTPRILCEVYAKLLALLVQHWLIVASCWGAPDKSLWQAACGVRSRAPALASALVRSARRLTEELRLLATVLGATSALNTRRRHPTTYQLLLADP